ncbi:gene transfer agent family protein [Sphingomonas sp. CLY1604]|uniref:gene transfer agent family protein n=1 Tax=Sphingomonas sp. CLY1604 TaxID=3457786 RepID=UPI003FD8EB61
MSGAADVPAAPAANPARGECAVRVNGCDLALRPSFQALVAAEAELGSLFDLVERAASGKLGIGELVTLFWHCLREIPEGITRERFGEALIAAGLARLTPVLRVLLGQILGGR